MMISGTEKKLGRQPIHDPPVVRNPLGIPLFDKSIYFAIFYIQDNIRFDEIVNCKNRITRARLIDSVEDFEKLMTSRKKMEQNQRSARKKEQQAVQRDYENYEKKLDQQNKAGMGVQRPRKPARMSSSTTRVVSGLKAPRKPKSTR